MSGAPSARARVLEAVRRAVSHATPHPGAHPAPALPASWETFAAALARVGGEALGPVARAELAQEALARARAWAAGGRIVAEPSALALLGDAPGVEAAPADAAPASFADVAVAIVRGALGVAESGAVAVLGRDAPRRALLFLAERVLLLLDEAHLVGDLHAAFRSLPPDALAAHHLTWISGPSKTADIEQTLVFGAHGPRALAVLGHRGA
ncbi:MAG TPA: LUD domain-containing protein [Myxococcota bacterium]|jgi:L-lactate dehydrogenase complex protein LldG